MHIEDIVGHASTIQLDSIHGREVASVSGIFYSLCHKDEYRLRGLVQEGFRPSVVWDIGGNVGIFSKIAEMVWPEAQIHAWEPNPALHAFFSANNSGAVVLHPKAATGFEGLAERS